MKDNKYYDSWQEWKRLCNDYEHEMDIEDYLDAIDKTYKGFSEAFIKAKKFDELVSLATEADSTDSLFDWLAENVITEL